MSGRARRRITFTFARVDVQAAVDYQAVARGCDVQDVINDILARVLVERQLELLRADVTTLQSAIQLLRAEALPPSLPFPVVVEEPILAARNGARSKNPWE